MTTATPGIIKQGFYVHDKPFSATNTPDLGLLPDGVHMILNDDLEYVDSLGRTHTAYRGLRTDGGTIPRFFWRVVGSPWTGKRRLAYVIHDQECEDVWLLPKSLRGVARKQADNNLYEMCRYLGDSRAAAWAVYSGVRIGWILWQRFSQPKGPRILTKYS